MGYPNVEKPKHIDGASLGADKSGEEVDVRNCLSGMAEVFWAGAGAASPALVKLQEKGVNGSWLDIAGKTTGAFGAATGTFIIKMAAADLQSPYIRAVLVHGAETVGTVTVALFFKRNN